MKISGPGSYAFRLLEEYYRKNEEYFKAKKLAKQLISTVERKFSPWELHVRHKLQKSNIKFEEKFRTFPLILYENTINYIPDFILSNHTFKNKKIIVEAHKDLTPQDVVKYGLFMKKFGMAYHLIMIVQYGQLRKWNEINQNERPLFHDIWTVEDLDHFIDYLKKHKTSKILNVDLPQHAVCPICGKKAEGTEQVEKLFGYRKMKNGKTIVQSYCKKHRSSKNHINNPKLEIKKQVISPTNRYCTECGGRFVTEVASQAHCNPCLKKFGLI